MAICDILWFDLNHSCCVAVILNITNIRLFILSQHVNFLTCANWIHKVLLNLNEDFNILKAQFKDLVWTLSQPFWISLCFCSTGSSSHFPSDRGGAPGLGDGEGQTGWWMLQPQNAEPHQKECSQTTGQQNLHFLLQTSESDLIVAA